MLFQYMNLFYACNIKTAIHLIILFQNDHVLQGLQHRHNSQDGV
jgi:hypothetical protein